MWDASATDHPEIATSCNKSATAVALRILHAWCVPNMQAKVVPVTDTLQD